MGGSTKTHTYAIPGLGFRDQGVGFRFEGAPAQNELRWRVIEHAHARDVDAQLLPPIPPHRPDPLDPWVVVHREVHLR